MKKYKVFQISQEAEDTEKKLNQLAKNGWKLICSYSKNNYWLIMEKEKEICPKCGK